MSVIYVAGAAFIGAIASGLLGWLDSQERFEARKFTSTVVRALIAGVGFAAAYQYTNNSLTSLDLAVAFLGGSGVDVLGNRISGSIKAGVYR
jgi:hypothetical protein